MKKFLSVILSLSLLTGCAARSTEVISETAEASEDVQQAAAESVQTEEESSEPADSTDEPKQELADSLLQYFEGMDTACLEYTESGEFVPYDYDEFRLRMEISTYEQYLSRESFDELMSYMGEYTDGGELSGEELGIPTTYGEYREYMLEMLRSFSDTDVEDIGAYFDENGHSTYTAEPAVLCIVDLPDAEDEVFPAETLNAMTLQYLTELPEGNEELKEIISAARAEGEDVYISLEGYYYGEGSLILTGHASCYALELECYYSEERTVQPEGGIYLNGVFIPEDTEKLFITSREEYVAEMLAGEFIPEDCLWMCKESSYGTVPVYDMKQLAEGLPQLKELYMYQAQAENTDAIADMTGLQVLSYYVSTDSQYPSETLNDLPFSELKGLRKLRIYGEYEDYSFLDGMDGLEEVFVEIMTDSAGLQSLFEQSCVTGVEISVIGSDGYGDLSGIGGMKNLRELKINGGNIDYDAIGRLSSLETLYIRAYNKADASALAKLDRVKDLTLMDVETNDWSFLADMDSLTALTLSYTNTRDKDIEMLDGLISLSLTETNNTYSVIGKLDSLETAFVMDILGSVDDIGGSDTLRSYGEMMGDGGDYSALLSCPKLTHITLWGCNGRFDAADFAGCGLEELFCNGTTVENPLALGDIPTLNTVELSYDDAETSLQEELQQLLPDCSITVNNTPFFHN